MTLGHHAMSNIISHRSEQIALDNGGIRYSLKTGNIFTDDSTFSKKRARSWMEQGYEVWVVNNLTGSVIAKANANDPSYCVPMKF